MIESRARSISYTLGDQEVTIPLTERSMCMVMRDHFDAHLLKHVQAEVHQGTAVHRVIEREEHVEVETHTGESFAGLYLVAADGANSSVARSLGLRRGKTLAAAIEAEVPAPPEVMHRIAGAPRFIFGETRLGYL